MTTIDSEKKDYDNDAYGRSNYHNDSQCKNTEELNKNVNDTTTSTWEKQKQQQQWYYGCCNKEITTRTT